MFLLASSARFLLRSEAKVVFAFTSLDAFRRPLRLRYACGAFRAARMVPPKHRFKVIFQVNSTLRRSKRELQGARSEERTADSLLDSLTHI